LLEAEPVAESKVVFFKEFFIVPEDVAPVYPDQHGVDLAALADVIKQTFGHDSVPAFTLIEDGDRNAVARLNVLAEEFVARMDLPSVGW
jgi:hypothetical protein